MDSKQRRIPPVSGLHRGIRIVEDPETVKLPADSEFGEQAADSLLVEDQAAPQAFVREAQ
jgi:hypothetical protein